MIFLNKWSSKEWGHRHTWFCRIQTSTELFINLFPLSITKLKVGSRWKICPTLLQASWLNFWYYSSIFVILVLITFQLGTYAFFWLKRLIVTTAEGELEEANKMVVVGCFISQRAVGLVKRYVTVLCRGTKLTNFSSKSDSRICLEQIPEIT